MSITLTIRIEPELKDRLDQLADATQRSRSFLAAEAIREFVDLNEWQIQEIKTAIEEVDAEDFANDQEVKRVFAKWGLSGD